MPPKKNKTTPSTPLPLPIEVFSIVFNHLLDTHPASLARCCRVSRSFFDLVAPILYRQIRVSNFKSLDSRADYSPDRFTATGKEKTNTRKKKLLKFAQIVKMDHHHAHSCGNKSFKYPKLKVLVLNLAVNGFGSVLHSNDILEKQCSLVKCLEPKKVVLNGISHINISTFEMFGVPPKLFQNLEELTLIAPIMAIRPRMITGGFAHMPKLKKLVWIFYTPNPTTKWVPGSQDFLGSGERYTRGFAEDLRSLARFLSTTPDVPTYVVNSGSIHHSCVGETSFNEITIQNKFKELLKAKIIQSGLEELDYKQRSQENSQYFEAEVAEESNRKFNNIRFLTMKEYVENHDWVGELHPNQAKLWIS